VGEKVRMRVLQQSSDAR